MLMRNAFIAVILSIILSLSGCSLIRNSSGTKSYNTGQYNKASLKLKKEFDDEKRKNLKAELAFVLGESYRLQNLPSKAASAYSKAIKNGFEGVEAHVYNGQSLLKSGKTELAKEAFTKALTIESTNYLAKAGIKSCDLVLNDAMQTEYKIEKIKSINSKYSDYGVTFDGENYDHIYFTSMRYVGKERSKSFITGQGFAHLFESTKNTKGEWTKPEKLAEPLNSPFEEGSPYVTSDGKEMYLTRCILDKTKVVEGQIYRVVKSAGIWGEPMQLQLGGDSILFAHPALSTDGNTLYFTSNMEGGKGGKDIWKIEKKGSEEWGKPTNLGYPLNTPGDEMFPYIKDNGVLYYSSNGLPGFGGLDIFKTIIDDDGDLIPENMGQPINSSSDDFGIAFMGKSEKGMFASSRENNKGDDNIFSFILPEIEFSLTVNLFNNKTLQPIKNSYLKIIGTDGTQLKLSVPADGKLKVGLIKDCDYTMLLAAKGFMYQRVKFTTKELSASKVFEYKIGLVELNEAFVLDSVVFETNSSKPSALTDSNIRMLNALLSANSDVTIEVGGHTDLTKEDNIDAQLSLKRAQAVADLMIENGFDAKRITTKGYENSEPLKINEQIANNNKSLKKGEFLSDKVIAKLRTPKEIEGAQQLLRRIEIKVLQKSK